VKNLNYVLSDFERVPEIKGFKNADELFSTTPPRGYRVIDHIKEGAKKKDQGLGTGRLPSLLL
jgi:hypothetical protein